MQDNQNDKYKKMSKELRSFMAATPAASRDVVLKKFADYGKDEQAEIEKKRRSGQKYFSKFATPKAFKNFTGKPARQILVQQEITKGGKKQPAIYGNVYQETKIDNRGETRTQEYFQKTFGCFGIEDFQEALSERLLYMYTSQRDHMVSSNKAYLVKDKAWLVSSFVKGEARWFRKQEAGQLFRDEASFPMEPYLCALEFILRELDPNQLNYLLEKKDSGMAMGRIDSNFAINYLDAKSAEPLLQLYVQPPESAAMIASIFKTRISSLIDSFEEISEDKSDSIIKFCDQVINNPHSFNRMCTPSGRGLTALANDLKSEIKSGQIANLSGKLDKAGGLLRLVCKEFGGLLIFSEKIDTMSQQDQKEFKNNRVNYVVLDKSGLMEINPGKEDDYMLFMRAVADFTETPTRVIDHVYALPSFGNYSKQGLAQAKKMSEGAKYWQGATKQFFAKEIVRFREMLKTEKYANAFNLQNIDWTKYRPFAPVRGENTSCRYY